MRLREVIQRNTRSLQPAAATVPTGTLYYVTDESIMERSSGTAWEAVGSAPGIPGPHATSHENGGADEIDVTGLSGVLADPQTPAAHTHSESDVTGLASDLAAKLPTSYLDTDGTLAANSDSKIASQKAAKTYVDTGLSGKQNSLGFTPENAANKNAVSGYAGLDSSSKLTGSQQVYGTTSNTACQGNDSRLSDSRAPNGSAGGDLSGSYPNPTVATLNGRNVQQILASGRQTATATGTGDQVLYTLAIPGGTLGTSHALRIVWCGRRTTGSGQVTWKTKYGGTTLDYGAGSMSSANARLDALLWADGATNAQRFDVWSTVGSSMIHTAVGTSTAAVDSSVSQNLTLEIALATSTDVVTLDYVLVEFIP